MKKLSLILIIFIATSPKILFTAQYNVKNSNTILTIERGEIENQQVDALVNPIGNTTFVSEIKEFQPMAQTIKNMCKQLKKSELKESIQRCIYGVFILPENDESARVVFNVLMPKKERLFTRKNPPDHIRRAYRNVLSQARQAHVRTIAIPSIGTIKLNYNVHTTAPIALQEIVSFLQANTARSLQEIRVILGSEHDLQAYAQEIEKSFSRIVTPYREKPPKPSYRDYWGQPEKCPIKGLITAESPYKSPYKALHRQVQKQEAAPDLSAAQPAYQYPAYSEYVANQEDENERIEKDATYALKLAEQEAIINKIYEIFQQKQEAYDRQFAERLSLEEEQE